MGDHTIGIIVLILTILVMSTGPVAPVHAQEGEKPKVAILVYDGVQIIDHAIPYEVFGQFSLNEVFTVARDTARLSTWMDMPIVPEYAFDDHPAPDVLVLPGGNVPDEFRDDPEVRAWIRRNVEAADHVLTVCTGIFFLAGTGFLEGRDVTTWYGRQDELAETVPGAHVIGERIVVEDGKFVSAAGSGIEGALRVLEKLHGPAWAEVVRLNMEIEPVPDSAHVPRVELADLELPDGHYAHIPWRDGELLRYEGDRDEWTMAWRFESEAPIDSLADVLAGSFVETDGWSLAAEERDEKRWTSRWTWSGRGGTPWSGRVALERDDATYELAVDVERAPTDAPANPACEDADPAWSPDGTRIAFVRHCGEEGDVHLVDPDGSDLVRLTDTPGVEHGPAWSPDGTRLAYSYHPAGEDPELWTIAADGSDARQVTDNAATDHGPTWSPEGDRIAYESHRDDGGDGDVWVVDLVDGAETRLTRDPSRDVAPSWSPDGATIAFQSNRGGDYAILGIAPEGGELRTLIDLPGQTVIPAWSPDGARIAFAYQAPGEDDPEIWIAGADGSDAVAITENDRADFAPAWSPDGTRLAFMAREGDAWRIRVVNADGTREKSLP